MLPPSLLSRRRLFGATLASAAGLLLHRAAAAGIGLVDPYHGIVPLAFPLQAGSFQTPITDNWHQAREGQLYDWNHQTAAVQRAHDGVDIYPLSGQALPPVFAPLRARVAAVCTRSANSLNGLVTYRVSVTTPPPWDYSQAADTVANLPMYGNFVWLYSVDPRSAGYFVFVCHLQNEQSIGSLRPDQVVTPASQIGVLGDSGNAAGTPQLHVELHYPGGAAFTCQDCSPQQTVTSIDAFASLSAAASS